MPSLVPKVFLLLVVAVLLACKTTCSDYCRDVYYLCDIDSGKYQYGELHAPYDRIKARTGKLVTREPLTPKISRWSCQTMTCDCFLDSAPKIGTDCGMPGYPTPIDHYRCKPEGSGGGIDP